MDTFNPRIVGVALDLEGTLIDGETLNFTAHAQAATELRVCNGTVVTAEFVLDLPQAIGSGDAHISQKLHEVSGGKVPAEQLLALKHEHHARLVQEATIEARSRCAHILSWLSIKANLKFAIGSSTPRDKGLLLLRKSGLYGYFYHPWLVFGDDVEIAGMVKPAPHIYRRTATLMGIEPRAQLVFEDSVPGVSAAVAAGSRVIAVPVFPQLTQQLLDAGAEKVFPSWESISVSDLEKMIS